MAKKKTIVLDNNMNLCNCSSSKYNGCGGAVYGLGFIGAAIYYISSATSFWMGALGLLKAIVWPAFLVFKLLVL